MDTVPTTRPMRRLSDDSRINEIVGAAADRAESVNPTVASAIRACAPAVELGVKAVNLVGPYYILVYSKAYEAYVLASPHADLMDAIWGFTLCFAGGNYCTIIAAYEAFRMCGWDTTKKNVRVIMSDIQKVREASAKDDEVDADGNGVADVKEMAMKDLACARCYVF